MVVVVAIVLVVVGESPPVDTLGFDEEHDAPNKARATTHAASPARRRRIRRSGEWDVSKVVDAMFVMTVGTGGSPVRFTRIEPAPQNAGRSRMDRDRRARSVAEGKGFEPLESRNPQ